MQVRRLGEEDGAAAEHACRLFGATGELDPTAFLHSPQAVLLIAEDESGIGGWVYGHELVHPDGERTMLLYELEVAPPVRRQGYGRALVSAFVDHARRVGCTEVWVLTDADNAPALATYRRAGGRRDPGAPVMFAWHLANGRHS